MGLEVITCRSRSIQCSSNLLKIGIINFFYWIMDKHYLYVLGLFIKILARKLFIFQFEGYENIVGSFRILQNNIYYHERLHIGNDFSPYESIVYILKTSFSNNTGLQGMARRKLILSWNDLQTTWNLRRQNWRGTFLLMRMYWMVFNGNKCIDQVVNKASTAKLKDLSCYMAYKRDKLCKSSAHVL